MEVLHNDRHLDRSITSVSRSAGTILHCLRLALSVSLSLATTSSCIIFQLTVEDDLWQSVVAHSYHVTQSSETELQSGVPQCRICYRSVASR